MWTWLVDCTKRNTNTVSLLRKRGFLAQSVRNASSSLSAAIRSVDSPETTTLDRHKTLWFNNEIVIETPFLIAGAGPVGTILSLLLGRLAVPHILVDRCSSITAIQEVGPQGHLLSNRSMESE